MHHKNNRRVDRMVTVMVVDDEYLVRRGIRETIDWQQYGFEIICEAANGLEGYDNYLRYRPDIIITDVRMKKMTGLSMIEKLKETDGFSSDIIVISAYDDFKYAQRAMESGVDAYILKPIQEKELISAMLRIKSEREIKQKQKNILDDYTRQIPTVKNLVILELLEGKYKNSDEIKNKQEMYRIELPNGEYTVACIKYDNLTEITENTVQLQRDLEEVLSYYARIPGDMRYEWCKIEDGFVALILFYHDDNYKLLQSSTSNLVNFLTNIKENIETISNRTVSIGFSLGHINPDEMKEAFDEAKRALAHKSFAGNGAIIDYITVPQTMTAALVFSNEDIERIVQSARKKTEEGLNIVNDFFEKVKSDSSIEIESLKDVILEMTVMILRDFFENTAEMNKVYGRRIVPSNELKRLETIYDIEEWTKEIIKGIYEFSSEKNPNRYIIRIKEEIEDKYSEPITVQSIADDLHISPYYLMHLFKEEEGKTFNQYLTEIRMNKAMQMLKTGEYKVYEIAEMLGYKDTTYFSYIFKKTTGHTPREIIANK